MLYQVIRAPLLVLLKEPMTDKEITNETYAATLNVILGYLKKPQKSSRRYFTDKFGPYQSMKSICNQPGTLQLTATNTVC